MVIIGRLLSVAVVRGRNCHAWNGMDGKVSLAALNQVYKELFTVVADRGAKTRRSVHVG